MPTECLRWVIMVFKVPLAASAAAAAFLRALVMPRLCLMVRRCYVDRCSLMQAAAAENPHPN